MGWSSWGERGGFCFVLKQFCKAFIDFVTLLLLCYVLFFGQEACGIVAP